MLTVLSRSDLVLIPGTVSAGLYLADALDAWAAGVRESHSASLGGKMWIVSAIYTPAPNNSFLVHRLQLYLNGLNDSVRVCS